MHEDTVFGERLNSFLVIESVLLGLVAMLNQQPGASETNFNVLPLLALLGASLTLILWYVQAKHRCVVKVVARRAEREFRELRVTKRLLKKSCWRGISASFLLAHVVPFVLLSVWLGLFVLFSTQAL
jgi:hypothetical protein